jgi:hypothetical protein
MGVDGNTNPVLGKPAFRTSLTDALDRLNATHFAPDWLPFDSVSSTTTCFRGFDDGKKLIKMILE